jgi:hypothetical protein
MFKLDVFGKTGCARCKTTRDKLGHLIRKHGAAEAVDLTYYDMDTIDGIAEGAFHGVTAIPTTILRDAGGATLARWDGRPPLSAEVNVYLAAAPGAPPA